MAAQPSASVYRELAELYNRQGQSQLRDRFMMLAADAAHNEGKTDEAEQLRRRLLQSNPHHMLKPFPTFAEAMRSPDVQTYLRDLRQGYPLQVGQQLLDSLRRAEAKKAEVVPNEDGKANEDVEEESADDFATLKFAGVRGNPVVPPEAAPSPAQKPVFPPLRQTRPTPLQEPLPGPLAPEAPPARRMDPLRATMDVRDNPVPPFQAVPPAPTPVRLPPLPHHEIPEPDPATPETTAEGWLALALFVLVLLCAIGLAAYTLLKPFVAVP